MATATATQKKWTIEEEAQLLQELAQGKTYLEIAIAHERQKNAIKRRHLKLVAEIKKIEKLSKELQTTSLDELASKINLGLENVITNPLFECLQMPPA